MRLRQLIVALLAAAVVSAASAGAVTPLSAPGVKAALLHAGFPARTQCGLVMEPPHGPVHACYVVVEHGGWSVRVVPYATSAAAEGAYTRTANASTTKKARVGRLVVFSFRVPRGDWLRVLSVVTRVAGR